MQENLEKFLEDLITSCSVDFPKGLEELLKESQKKEKGIAKGILGEILENIKIAREAKIPICQDTGVINFYVKIPESFLKKTFEDSAYRVIRKLVKKGTLRSNSAKPLDDFSIEKIKDKDISSCGVTNFYFEEGEDGELVVDLLLKGGGSENMSAQYSLPDKNLNARRDLEGILACVEDAVKKAAGKGCPPGILGIAVGGDRSTGHIFAKKQLLREIDDDSDLSKIEDKITKKCNNLRIGPGGTGGKTTVLYSKIAFLPRHPACFFVTISYNCWALRKKSGKFINNKR